MESFLQDVRYAFRALLKRPGFTVVAVTTLALGIGAVTAIFSVVHGVLIRPLPYDQPDRIVQVLGYDTRRGLERGTLAYPNFVDVRAEAESFQAMAAYDEWQPVLVVDGAPERIGGASVTAGFFEVLGVEPAVGRFFLDEEDDPRGEPVAVLSHGAWVRRFGADPAVVGSPVELDGTAYTVVGVAPRDFEDPGLSGDRFADPEVWRVTPAYFDVEVQERGGRSFTAIGRLRPGVSPERARRELEGLMARLAEAYPEDVANRSMTVVPIAERLVGPTRTALLVLFGAVGLVLLIACANVASLLLGRAADREREMGIRASLGAGRLRIVRQLLTESVLLALVGGGAGLLLAWLGTDALVSLAGDALPRAGGIGLDGWALAFTGSVVVVTGLVFGAAPATYALRVDLRSSLREGGRGGGHGARGLRLRHGLVVAEVTMAVVLLVGSGLLLRSLHRLHAVDPGLRPEGVLTFRVDLPFDRYGAHPQIDGFYRELLPRLRGLPGADGVATANILPMSGSFNGMGLRLEDRPPPPPGEGLAAETRAVTPGYFATLGIPVVRGRGFDGSDGADAPPVVVVNRAMADRFWPGGDPVGKRITAMGRSREVVGVAGDVRLFALDEPPEATMYVPGAQAPAWMRRDVAVAIRAAGDPRALAGPVRAVVGEVDGRVPVEELRTLDAMVRSTTAGMRFRTLLLAIFAAVALTLGAVGIYGVVSSTVSRRVREMGIRIALGAGSRRVVGLVLREGMAPVAVGVVVGTATALLGAGSLSSLLYGVEAGDPLTFITVVGVLGGVALAACWVPARRAVSVDPARTLREE